MTCDFQDAGEVLRCSRCNMEAPKLDGITSYHAECRASCSNFGEPAGQLKIPCNCGVNGSKIVILVSAFRCTAHGRCLPHWSPPDAAKWAEQPEAKIYTPCAGCTSFAAAASAP